MKNIDNKMYSGNLSHSHLYFPTDQTELWYLITRGIIFFISLVGNGTVIFLITSRPKLQRTTNWLILSLAIADISLTIIITPIEAVCTLHQPSKCDLWILWLFYTMAINTSTFNLCLLTVDRYIAVSYPLRYQRLKLQLRLACRIALTWALAMISPLPCFIAIRYDAMKAFKDLEFAYLVLCECVPSITLLLIYIQMVRVVTRRKRDMKQQRKAIQFNYSSSSVQNISKQSSLHIVGALVFIFDLCFLVSVYEGISHYVLAEPAHKYVVSAARVLYHVNAAANGPVYAVMKGDFRQELRRLVRGSPSREIEEMEMRNISRDNT
ncbi:adenosine receptor A2b [Nematostella vectensis]|uniref:adenosine receptor A2b n=1 Tax=Nematostella vectensis TaxID=45351 RepID=UPI001390076E|nr:adenosine receptor A2b [Nematostella vectensis]